MKSGIKCHFVGNQILPLATLYEKRSQLVDGAVCPTYHIGSSRPAEERRKEETFAPLNY